MFKQAGAEVVGVGSNSEASHQQFASKRHLPFILLSDTKGALRKLYGVPSAPGMPGRVTYVIDKAGLVRHIFSSQLNIGKHITEAIRILQEITN